ncbi:MAG: hypothetical protein HY268_31210 [Deltaproteobacteria bacterium]|nr:hypothetical protein [Deltaproteobacteria bacterium]
MSTPTSSQLAHEILAYLAEYPEIQDTLEGIVEWWLLEQQINCRLAQVKAALAELVAQGLVLERQGKDARSHYRLNQQKFGEIKVILKESSD